MSVQHTTSRRLLLATVLVLVVVATFVVAMRTLRRMPAMPETTTTAPATIANTVTTGSVPIGTPKEPVAPPALLSPESATPTATPDVAPGPMPTPGMPDAAPRL